MSGRQKQAYIGGQNHHPLIPMNKPSRLASLKSKLGAGASAHSCAPPGPSASPAARWREAPPRTGESACAVSELGGRLRHDREVSREEFWKSLRENSIQIVDTRGWSTGYANVPESEKDVFFFMTGVWPRYFNVFKVDARVCTGMYSSSPEKNETKRREKCWGAL